MNAFTVCCRKVCDDIVYYIILIINYINMHYCVYRKVLAEVEKIRQFESLWASETPDGEGCVQQVLRRTTEALRDINALLEK